MDIQLFNYDSNAVRAIEQNGEVWFVAKDVCDVLELSNPTEALRALDDDEKNTLRISEGIRGNPTMNVINESGLYRLAFRSNKPMAKDFTRWVAHTVLPEIRRTGSYSARKGLPSGILEGAKMIFEAAGIKDNQLSLAMDKVYQSYTGRSALAIGEIYLEVQTKRQALTPTEIGQRLGGMSPRRVNEILAGAGYQYNIGNNKWEPLEKGLPFAVMVDTNKRHSNGTPVRQLKWDSSILELLHDRVIELNTSYEDEENDS